MAGHTGRSRQPAQGDIMNIHIENINIHILYIETLFIRKINSLLKEFDYLCTQYNRSGTLMNQ